MSTTLQTWFKVESVLQKAYDAANRTGAKVATNACDAEEYAQDGICSAWQRAGQEATGGIAGDGAAEKRLAEVCRRVVCAVRNSAHALHTFGHPSPSKSHQQLPMDHSALVEQLAENRALEKMDFAVWITTQLPEKHRALALVLSQGDKKQDAAKALGITDRTVRRRLAELREYLDPPIPASTQLTLALAGANGMLIRRSKAKGINEPKRKPRALVKTDLRRADCVSYVGGELRIYCGAARSIVRF